MRTRGRAKKERVRTPVIRIRPAGGVYVALSVVLGVISVNSGNNLLYLVTALLLGYMLTSGIAGRRNVMGAEARAELPDAIYAGRAFRLVVTVRNRRRSVPLYLVEVAAKPLGAAGEHPPLRVFFGLIPPGEEQSRSVWMTLPRRGRERVALELSSAYPFDFFVRWGRTPQAAEALVFPTPLLEGGAPGYGEEESEADGEVAGRASSDATDVSGVRPYQAGDPVSRIHWKLSARTGALSTRLFEGASPPEGRTIDLDALVSANGVERGLSLAAGRIVEAEREDVPLGMKDRGIVLAPASGRAVRLGLLRRLALYECVGEGEGWR